MFAVGQSEEAVVTGGTSAREVTRCGLSRAKPHLIQRFGRWLHKTYAMVMISGIIYTSGIFSKWVARLGWFAAAVHLLAQTELLPTAIPGFPVIGWAGLYGSLLWLAWMIVVGVRLVKYKND